MPFPPVSRAALCYRVAAAVVFSVCRWLCVCLCAQATLLEMCSPSAVLRLGDHLGWCGRQSGCARHQACSSLSLGCERGVVSSHEESGVGRYGYDQSSWSSLSSKEERRACRSHLAEGREWALPGCCCCCWNSLHVLNFSWHSPQWYKSKKLLSFQSRGLWSGLWLLQSRVRCISRLGLEHDTCFRWNVT